MCAFKYSISVIALDLQYQKENLIVKIKNSFHKIFVERSISYLCIPFTLRKHERKNLFVTIGY